MIKCNLDTFKGVLILKLRATVAQVMSKHLVIERSLVRFSWSAYQSVRGQDTEPQTALDVLVGSLHGSHQPSVYECMYESL